MTDDILKLVTFNRGDHAALSDVLAVLEGTDAAALNEMYDQQHILDALEEHGYRVIRFPEVEGARANPVVFNPERLRLLKPFHAPLLPAATRDGKHNMAKHLVAGRFLFKAVGRPVIVGSIHNIQTQYTPHRRGPSEEFVRNLLQAADRRSAPTFIGGDWNCEPNGPSLAPLRQAEGWKCDQIVGSRFYTHERRTIDMWWWDDRDHGDSVVRFHKHYAKDIGRSDHKPVYAEFEVSK